MDNPARTDPTWTVYSHSEQETRRLGRALGAHLRPGHIVLLGGPLGAGKTVFVQGVGEGMGLEERVTSPSFTLVHHYGYGGAVDDRDGVRLVHVDLYRLNRSEEVEGLGLDDAAASAAVVEWWRRAPDAFPPGRLEIELEPGPGSRAACTAGRRIRAHGRLLAAWRAEAGGDGGTGSRD